MRIGRAVAVLIAAHAGLKTGVHAVTTSFLAKTSQADQSLGDDEIPEAIARDAEVTAAVADEATARDLAIATHADLASAHHVKTAAVTIATGQYVGNDALDRQITTGFKCSLVILSGVGGGVETMWYMTPDITRQQMGAVAWATQTANLSLHATDGFVVADIHANYGNDTGVTYTYWAISE